MPAFLSSLISYFVFRFGVTLLSGEAPRILDLPIKASLNTPRHFLNSLVVGIAAGLVGTLFVKVFHNVRTRIAPRFRPEVSALTGIAIASLISFITLKSVAENVPFGGTGFSILHFLGSRPDVSMISLIILLTATIAACSFAVAMHVSGGVFGPALVVGGSTGGILGLIVDPANLSSYIVIGMSAVHTATTKTPIASLVLIMEMTDFPPIFFALAIANVAAFFVSGDNSLYYTKMKGRFEEIVKELTEIDVLSRLKVEDIMESSEVFSFQDEQVFAARKLFSEKEILILPVIDSDNILRGTIMKGDIGDAEDNTFIKDVMKKPLLVLRPQESLEEAMYHFYDLKVEQAPVAREEGAFLGFLSLRDIIKTYRKHVAGP